MPLHQSTGTSAVVRLPPNSRTAQQSAIVTPASPNETAYPVEVFGHLPAGFELRNQSVHLLAHWHRKALKAIAELTDKANEKEVDAACKIARDILEAILAVEADTAGEVAVQLAAAVETIDYEENNSIEEVLDVDDVRRLATNLTKATTAPRPTKRVGALHRGRKLTRSGLLHRYHAFLLGELHTLGLELYGNADYAKSYLPFDDAVNKRCRAKRPGPFFDPRKLADRARSVFKSLKIDTDVARRK